MNINLIYSQDHRPDYRITGLTTGSQASQAHRTCPEQERFHRAFSLHLELYITFRTFHPDTPYNRKLGKDVSYTLLFLQIPL